MSELTNEIWQYFSRHILIGLVICLIVLIPVFFIFDILEQNDIFNQPLLIILVALIIGLFFNTCKLIIWPFKLFEHFENSDRNELETIIIESFDIVVQKKTVESKETKSEKFRDHFIDFYKYLRQFIKSTEKKNPDKRKELSTQIIDSFLAFYHPDLFMQLQFRRNEIDVTITALAAIFFICITGILYVIIALLKLIYCSLYYNSNIYLFIDYVMWFFLFVSIIWLIIKKGFPAFKNKLNNLNLYTGHIVAKAFKKQKEDDEKANKKDINTIGVIDTYLQKWVVRELIEFNDNKCNECLEK